jgi:hypothetical protein
MSTRRHALAVCQLESRDVPAVALGDGWYDPANLTISFAADGTLIGQPPPGAVEVHTTTTALLGTLGLSAVNSLLSPLTGTVDGLTGALTSGPDSHSNAEMAFGGLAGWRVAILRAFQSWVAVTNVNVGLTADSMAAFGTSGQFQGDSRFGDIRIGGTKLNSGVLANAMIVSPDNGTWSGDVLFNTAMKFGSGGYDLFTVALHEAGHVFGLEHSDDPYSVMSESYLGARSGLSAGDVATIRSYYGGARQADAFDLAGANGTRGTATALAAPGNFFLLGDLTTASDTDWYSFKVPAGKGAFEVRLDTAGLSLLTAKLSVVDAAGNVLGSAVSTDPLSGNLKVTINNATAGGTYYLKVNSATADFGVGRYRLSVSGLGGTATDLTPAGAATVNIAPPAADPPVLATGTLTKTDNKDQFTYTMASSGLFELSAEATSNVGGVDLIVEVFDASGSKVLSFTQKANGTSGGKSAYLQAGTYAVRTTAVIPLLSFGAKVQYTLSGGVESDPMGTAKPGTGSSPYPTSGSGTTSGGTATSPTAQTSTTTKPYSY